MNKITALFKKKEPEQYTEPFTPVARDTKVRMTRTIEGSPDGIHVQRFIQGKKYMVSKMLADLFVNELEAAEYL